MIKHLSCLDNSTYTNKKILPLITSLEEFRDKLRKLISNNFLEHPWIRFAIYSGGYIMMDRFSVSNLIIFAVIPSNPGIPAAILILPFACTYSSCVPFDHTSTMVRAQVFSYSGCPWASHMST